MKPTEMSTYRNLQAQMNRMSERLDTLRQSAVTGKRLNRPSDDPAAIRPVLDARTRLRGSEVNLKLMGSALGRMQTTDGRMGQIEDVMVRVKELAINSINGTLDAKGMKTLADQVGQLRGELLDIANSKVDGKFLFAGFAEGTQPFEPNPSYDPSTYDPADEATWPVRYRGDGNASTLEIPPGDKVQINVTGNRIFMGDAGGVDLFAALTRIEEAMLGNNPQVINDELDALDAGADQARLARGRLGNTAQRVERAMGHLEESRDDLQVMLSRYEDADLIEVLSNLTRQETAFETALQVTARVSKMTLLDYL